MSRYLCLPCGYIFDEDKSVTQDNTTVKFEDMPINWVCPECGAGKYDFELMDED